MITAFSTTAAFAEENAVQTNLNSDLTKATYDPDFIKYQQHNDNPLSVFSLNDFFQADESIRSSGIIPHPVGVPSGSTSLDTSTETYPDSFDLRDENRVTSIKDQGNSGSCWTFATYASLESTLSPSQTYDFSENNMKNLLSSSYIDGFDRSANSGGNYQMSTAYLARMSGPILESDDPYDQYSTTSPVDLEPAKFINEVMFLPKRDNSSDNDLIKWTLVNHGAIYSSIYYDNNYYNSNNSSYYYNAGTTTNHAITIVGWNDSYDRNNFDQKPVNNGAFIVKNSWGTTWGDDGYFYISYEDTCIGSKNAHFNATDIQNYMAYYHDPLGWGTSVTFSISDFWAANVFEAEKTGKIEVIGFYTPDVDIDYETFVYSGNACDGSGEEELLYSCNGTIPFAGYHTVNINEDTILEEGENFTIVLKLTNNVSPAHMPIENNITAYSSHATAEPGESYYSSTGVTWADLTGYLPDANFCMKAFVEPLSPTITSHEPEDTDVFSDEHEEMTFSVSLDIPANVSWYIDGSPVQENTTISKANYSVTPPDSGSYNITAVAHNQWGSDSFTWDWTVNELVPPIADFTADVTEGKVPLTVNFTDSSTNADTWAWDFDNDGVTDSTMQDPQHTYNAAGTYTVKLTVTNEDGSDTVTKTDFITVNALVPPVADFTADVTEGKVPLKVNFTDSSTNADTWAWDFDNDGVTDSVAQNPQHTYNAAGTYTVKLTVTNEDGSDTVTKTDLITVNALVPPVADFTADVTEGKVPLTVNFTDSSTNADTWAWDFDNDGVTDSTMQDPQHTYNAAGTYTVKLTVTNEDGSDTVTKTDFITVNALVPPVADFTADVTEGKVPLTVNFTDSSTNADTWAWDFDNDGVTDSTMQDPQHTYNAAGTYTVKLTVTNEDGSDTVTKTDFITVNALVPPVADFTADVTEGKVPLKVNFTDSSTNADTWAWDFDNDGVTDSVAQNPQHTYNAAGTYTVKLTVTNEDGSDTVTKTDFITVNALVPPVADFTADVTEGKVPLKVNFTDSSTNADTWAWDFDNDGVTDSVAQNPQHTYNAAGTYTVKLTVTNEDGSDTVTKTDFITVNALVPPIADFTADVTEGKVPLTVNFTDSSTNADTWAWDFDNDGVTDSTMHDPQHTYNAAGTYTVKLTVTNEDGSDTVTKTDFITVNALVPPVADFTADVTEGKVPLTVNFTDSSTNADTWAWDFDNDGVTDSVAQNPQHTYNAAGTYTVKLTVTNEDGSDTVTKTDLITVNALVPPVADFTADVTEGKVPLTVNFTDSSTNADTWAWDFDNDGVTDSTMQDPQHTYNAAGTYTVKLTVTNEDGSDTVTKTDFITVNALVPPVADFTADVTEGKVPLTVNFTDSSTNADTWAWDFDNDGVTDSTMQDPQHTYNAAGTYTVKLTVTNEDGSDTVTKTDFITVNALVPPVADFTADVTEGKVPLKVNFTDSSTNADTWAWDFDNDGVTDSTMQDPQHTYNAAGTYTVKLTVTNEDGSDTVTKTDFITVNALVPPVADFTADVTEGKVPLTVNFTDSSTNADTWAWDFDNDGVTDSTMQDPQHTYNAAGTYTVKLTVTNEDGSDTVTKTDLITVNALVPPVADFTADVTEGKVPLKVNFTDSSTNADTWAWDFDNDGVTDSTMQDPQHTYNAAGTYTVKLTVTNEDGSDTVTKTDLITVNALVPPVADFTADVRSGDAPLTVNFTDLSTNATSWEWDFENDGAADSAAQNPQHTYNVAGTYTVSLTVTNEDGSDTVTKEEYIIVSNPTPPPVLPVANFIANVTSGDAPLTVEFTDLSSHADAWEWDFDNDGLIDSIAQNPLHTYDLAGTYTVSLMVSNNDGTSNMTREAYIVVSDPTSPPIPIADFTANVTSGNAPLTVQFTDLSSHADEWEWDFDNDGIIDSDLQNPMHTYEMPGSYTVTLTVTGNNSTDNVTKTGYITAYDPNQEIPEFPTIALPMLVILGLAFVIQRRKD